MHRLFSTQLKMQTISLNRREYIDISMGFIFFGSPCTSIYFYIYNKSIERTHPGYYSFLIFKFKQLRNENQFIVYINISLNLFQTSSVFTCLQYRPFENTVGKGEIARKKQFLLFSQCFLPVWRTFCHFHQI